MFIAVVLDFFIAVLFQRKCASALTAVERESVRSGTDVIGRRWPAMSASGPAVSAAVYEATCFSTLTDQPR